MVPLESSPFLLEQRSSHTTSSCSFIDLYFREYFIQHFPVMHRLRFMYGTVCPSSTTARRRRLTPWSLVAFPTHGARWGGADIARDARERWTRWTRLARKRATCRRGSCFGGGGAGGRELLPDLHHGRRRHARGSAKAKIDAAFASTPAPEEASHADARGRQRRAGPSTVPGRALGSGWGHEDELSLERVQVRPLVETRSFATLPFPAQVYQDAGPRPPQSLLAKSRNSRGPS